MQAAMKGFVSTKNIYFEQKINSNQTTALSY